MFPNNPSDWRPAEPAPSTPPISQPVSTSTPRRNDGPRHASLAATLLAVALFGGLIGFAADRWISANPNPSIAPVAAAAPTTVPVAPAAPAVPTVGSSPRVGGRAAQQTGSPTAMPTAAPATVAATDPQTQAIQQVIQKGDEEQQQAFTNDDPTVMADTSTPDFYQQQVQINADMKNNGVSAIKLIGIEWGQIGVSGTTATATAWETWSTTYSDGTTEQSRDRNVYTLVQDNGPWKVSADAHPDDPLASLGGTPGQSTQPGQPRGPRGQSSNTSQNWSGYAATGGTYTSVSGTWTVPQFTPDSTAGADAAWVGIGGVNTRDLIQAGTQQTVSGSGSTQYEAWVETLPQASHPVPLTINPGDSITVTITQQPQAADQWLISMKNETSGQTFQVTETYNSSMSSVEWIEEAPSAARGRQVPLDNFGTVNFTAGSAVKDGQDVTIAAAGGKPITMIGRGGQAMASPSPLNADGSSFTVTRG